MFERKEVHRDHEGFISDYVCEHEIFLLVIYGKEFPVSFRGFMVSFLAVLSGIDLIPVRGQVQAQSSEE